MYGNHGYGEAEYGGIKTTLGVITKALVLGYNIRNAIAKALIVLYGSGGFLAKILTIKYNMAILVSKRLILKYESGGVFGKALTLLYKVFGWKPQPSTSGSYVTQPNGSKLWVSQETRAGEYKEQGSEEWH